jgi:hypothetical protein
MFKKKQKDHLIGMLMKEITLAYYQVVYEHQWCLSLPIPSHAESSDILSYTDTAVWKTNPSFYPQKQILQTENFLLLPKVSAAAST